MTFDQNVSFHLAKNLKRPHFRFSISFHLAKNLKRHFFFLLKSMTKGIFHSIEAQRRMQKREKDIKATELLKFDSLK